MNDPTTLLRQAAGHFQARQFTAAKAMLDRVVRADQSSTQALMMLAVTCRELGDEIACGAALDKLLQIEPRIVRALLMKGDLAEKAQDVRGATAFYKRALGEAEAQAGLSDDIQQQLESARRWIDRATEAERQRLEEGLEQRGLGRSNRSRRFQASLDIMSGRKQLFLQQPAVYYFPGLPQIEFYEPEQFAWAAVFEEQTEVIRNELVRLLQEKDLFAPYMVSNGRPPPSGYHGLLDNPDWSSLYLWSNGAPVEENAARCPRTMAALERVPLAQMSVRAPVVMFSLLKGGARIPPHHGSTNARLICHLPLLVPGKCGFRVGGEVQEWQEGKLLIFDDTIEHEAWNESDKDRVVLIFDIWRPELNWDEQEAVRKMFETLDAV